LQYVDDTLLFLEHDRVAACHLKWLMVGTSLAPGGGFIKRLSGDVGGPPHRSSYSMFGESSSSGTPGGSTSSSSDTRQGGFI
jgi:hypothetical protein